MSLKIRETLKGQLQNRPPKIIELPHKPMPVPLTTGSTLPIIHVLITITNFRNLLRPLKDHSALSEYTMRLRTRHPNVCLRYKKDDCGERIQQTLRIKNEGAILRFMVSDENAGCIYRPAAVMFTRIYRNRRRGAVYVSSGNQMGVYTPFSMLQLNGPTFQFTDTLPAKSPRKKKPALYKRYASSLIIQGSTGMFEYDVENADGGALDNDNELVPDDPPEPEDWDPSWIEEEGEE